MRPIARDAVEINLDVNRWLADNKSADQMVIYPCTNSGYGTSEDGSVRTEESPLNPVLYTAEQRLMLRMFLKTPTIVQHLGWRLCVDPQVECGQIF